MAEAAELVGGRWSLQVIGALLAGLGGRVVLAAEILGGRRVTIRIDDTTLSFFDPETRELLRTRPSPFSYDQIARLHGARPAGPPPRPTVEPVRVQRRASNSGVIMVAGQKVALGRIHARATVTVYVADTTLTIEAGDDIHTVARTTTQTVRNIRPMRAPQGRPISPRATVARHLEPKRQASGEVGHDPAGHVQLTLTRYRGVLVFWRRRS